MVGKKSGKALLREEGEYIMITVEQLLTVCCRPGKDRQQSGIYQLAPDSYDQPEELLYVSAFLTAFAPYLCRLLVLCRDTVLPMWFEQELIQLRYHSEFLKRDDQVLSLRLQNEEHRSRMMRVARDRDRALAQSGHDGLIGPEADIDIEEDIGAEESGGLYGYDASKIIVIHPGSQNLRVGLASDALPKTTPMCIARKSKENEAEENGGEPRPKRRKLEDGTVAEPEEQFGDEVRTCSHLPTKHTTDPDYLVC